MWLARREAALGYIGVLGLRLTPPRLVPWTRKAHELHAHAARHGVSDEVRLAVFDAFFSEGKDIGRVDVLVDIGAGAGLERLETKAVLDVDRHETDVASLRREAQELGVDDVPCYLAGSRLVRGFPDPAHLHTFLPQL
jgi:predicted DsbA family dithiol-disulfide isomerase